MNDQNLGRRGKGVGRVKQRPWGERVHGRASVYLEHYVCAHCWAGEGSNI